MRASDIRRSPVGKAIAGCALSLLLVGAIISSPSSPAASSNVTHNEPSGGTATYADFVGHDEFTWLLPLVNSANDEPWLMADIYDLYRPLYYPGDGSSPIINYGLSLAYPPVYSAHNTVVTIKLRRYFWSDGEPVTTKDVRLDLNLYLANRSAVATYIPGEFPSNIRRVDYLNSTTFRVYLNRSYSEQWFTDNELTQIVPMPQQLWDRTSSSGRVSNFDLTSAGAKAVFGFMTKQAETLSTYASNPLWHVVDGPWRLTAYNPTTFRAELSRNTRYSGPDKPHLDHVIFISFPSDTAEIDALRSGQIDYGYLPYSDIGLRGYLQSHGFSVVPWAPSVVQEAELGYTSPTYGPLVRQLYIRQALQHVIDEPLYRSTTMHGIGQLTYGPVPNIPHSPYVSPEEKTDPDPYSIGAARGLLQEHGWHPGSGGIMTCTRPGTGSGDCGAGIQKGRQLTLLMMYTSAHPTLTAQVEAFQSAAAAAGINIKLDTQSENTMFAIGGICPPGPCNWGIILYETWFWDYGYPSIYPSNGLLFKTGNYWAGGYSSAVADRLITAAQTNTGLKYLFADENYLSRQIAMLWFPTWDSKILVVKNTLGGWEPLPAFPGRYISAWYLR